MVLPHQPLRIELGAVSKTALKFVLWKAVSGPSGKEDSDNMALQVASSTLIVFECKQEGDSVLHCKMKFIKLNKHVLYSVPLETSE